MPTLLQALLAAALVLLTATGCTRLPQAETYAMTYQHKMQAAHHWNVLASDVANQINTELVSKGYMTVPLFVRHSCGVPDACEPGKTFPFDEAFNDLLTTQLVNFGVPMVTEPTKESLTVDYKVQVVYHQTTRYQWPRPGSLTALAAGIVVLRDAPWEIISIATAGALDAARATSTVNGHYEVIISTSIVDDKSYVVRKSDIYYINDQDFWHYQQPATATEIDLIGAQ